MFEKVLIDKNRIPEHIAIIMDGNGRWAEKIGKSRTFGHKAGVTTVKKIVRTVGNSGIKYLTLYTFSTENWGRPKEEVSALMEYLMFYLKTEIETLKKDNVRLLTIGNTGSLPINVQLLLNRAIHDTASNTGLTLILALSYGAKQDIVFATKKIYADINVGKLNISELSDKIFSKYLSTSNIPDPDLLIRTGGEVRISNFLLWELSYTELYFTKTLWPDFDENELYKAINDYCTRERRCGKTSEQLLDLK